MDEMTADWIPSTVEFFGKMSNEINNRVKGVNRVVL